MNDYYRPGKIRTDEETMRTLQALSTELGVERGDVYGAAFELALENEERFREIVQEKA